MKRISVLGSPSYELNMFILELAWALSRENNVLCCLGAEFYSRFAIEGERETSLGLMTLIRDYEDLSLYEGEDHVLITDALFKDSDTIVYVIAQTPFSAQFLEDFADLELRSKKVLVFLGFIDSPFDEDYFKKYQLNKKLLENVGHEERILFDEEVRRRQLENTLNRVITVKKYPKTYKHNLYSLANYFTGENKVSYKEFYKELDKRVTIC